MSDPSAADQPRRMLEMIIEFSEVELAAVRSRTDATDDPRGRHCLLLMEARLVALRELLEQQPPADLLARMTGVLGDAMAPVALSLAHSMLEHGVDSGLFITGKPAGGALCVALGTNNERLRLLHAAIRACLEEHGLAPDGDAIGTVAGHA